MATPKKVPQFTTTRQPTFDEMKPDEQLAVEISKYYKDPLGYVMFIFPWDSDPALQVVDWDSDIIEPSSGKTYNEVMEPYKKRFNSRFGPDLWACQFLDQWGDEIAKRAFNGTVAVDPIQFSVASGHGIGKSTLSAWIIKFIMDTRPFSQGTVTANTAEQLRTKTWAELGKWHKRSLTQHWFKYNSGRGNMSLKHEEHTEEWYCSAQTCREENSEAFAGQHAANATSFYLFDEASAVPDKIFEVREGGTTDGEPMTFDFGNPTRNSGQFFENCMGRFSSRYITKAIDSRSVFITNKKRINEWVEDYGLESDFVKVRVLGQFPSMGSLQFISSGLVAEAQERDIFDDPHAPLLIGVDVARFGDDRTVIWPRMGMDCRSWKPTILMGADTVEVEGKVIEVIRSFQDMGKQVAGLFVDGGGVGGGVVDRLRHLGYQPIEVQFGGSPIDKNTYRFKSDEMWGKMRDAMPRLCLPAMNQPNGVELYGDLTKREFGYTISGNKIHLETKKDMKARGVPSPDMADALALTFAQDVAPRKSNGTMAKPRTVTHDYDPLAMKD